MICNLSWNIFINNYYCLKIEKNIFYEKLCIKSKKNRENKKNRMDYKSPTNPF